MFKVLRIATATLIAIIIVAVVVVVIIIAPSYFKNKWRRKITTINTAINKYL